MDQAAARRFVSVCVEVADVRLPAVEARDLRGSGLRVVFGELADERTDRATAARLLADLSLDLEVEPAVDAGQESRWSSRSRR